MRLVKYSDNLEDDESKTVLWTIGKRTRFTKIAEGINLVLPVLVIFVAVFIVFSDSPRTYGDVLGHAYECYLIVFFSLFIHAFAHYCSAVSYKKRKGRIGLVSTDWFYTNWFIEADRDEFTTWQKIQMSASGIEANLLAAGSVYLIAALRGMIGEAEIFFIVFNLIIAGVNILPVFGSDGESIVSAVFGRNSILRDTVKFFTEKDFRKMLTNAGRIGLAWKSIYITKYVIDSAFVAGIILVVVLFCTNNISI